MERGRAGFARRPTGGFPTLEQEGSVREGGGVAGNQALGEQKRNLGQV